MYVLYVMHVLYVSCFSCDRAVQDVEIGQDKIRVGVAKFGSRPYREFNLDRYSNKTDLMAAINDIRYLDGGTDTAAAINYMDQVMFSVSLGWEGGCGRGEIGGER